MSATGSELYAEGKLAQAIDALNAAVKRKPTDRASRGLLAELLCAAGNLERADKQLEVLINQDLENAVGISLFRHCIRADQSRHEFYLEGRVPEFVGAPTPLLQKHLEASILIRDGDFAGAASTLDEAEQARSPTPGECDGERFDDFRDLDDLTAPLLEVLTTNGKYYWVALESVEALEFRPPERPRDLLWRPAKISVRGGPDGEVFVPAVYLGSETEDDERLALGRSTDWKGGDGAPVRGLGQRSFLVGESDRTIMSIETLAFDEQGS